MSYIPPGSFPTAYQQIKEIARPLSFGGALKATADGIQHIGMGEHFLEIVKGWLNKIGIERCGRNETSPLLVKVALIHLLNEIDPEEQDADGLAKDQISHLAGEVARNSGILSKKIDKDTDEKKGAKLSKLEVVVNSIVSGDRNSALTIHKRNEKKFDKYFPLKKELQKLQNPSLVAVPLSTPSDHISTIEEPKKDESLEDGDSSSNLTGDGSGFTKSDQKSDSTKEEPGNTEPNIPVTNVTTENLDEITEPNPISWLDFIKRRTTLLLGVGGLAVIGAIFSGRLNPSSGDTQNTGNQTGSGSTGGTNNQTDFGLDGSRISPRNLENMTPYNPNYFDLPYGVIAPDFSNSQGSQGWEIPQGTEKRAPDRDDPFQVLKDNVNITNTPPNSGTAETTKLAEVFVSSFDETVQEIREVFEEMEKATEKTVNEGPQEINEIFLKLEGIQPKIEKLKKIVGDAEVSQDISRIEQKIREISQDYRKFQDLATLLNSGTIEPTKVAEAFPVSSVAETFPVSSFTETFQELKEISQDIREVVQKLNQEIDAKNYYKIVDEVIQESKKAFSKLKKIDPEIVKIKKILTESGAGISQDIREADENIKEITQGLKEVSQKVKELTSRFQAEGKSQKVYYAAMLGLIVIAVPVLMKLELHLNRR